MRFISLSLIILSSLSAECSVNSLFSDGMVLQRQSEIKVWGTDIAKQAISVQLNDNTVKTAADKNGSWSLQLPAMKAGGPYALTIQGSSTIEIKDILIGEVWLCSGQSNMAFPLEWLKNADNPLSEKLPELRLFKVEKSCGGNLKSDVKGSWSNANGNIAKWSGTAFHFGRYLHQHLKVPVGLINSSVGGTPLESWCDHKVLDSLPELKGHVGWINGQIKKGKWEPDNAWRPAGLYNHMIHPLAGYTIKGAVWYQGESNAGRGNVYGNCLKGMITDWRTKWDQGDFPFITVQLANHIPKNHKKNPTAWADVREAQSDSLELDNTGIALCIDIGEEKDVHPKNKKDLGYRISLQARKLAYNENIEYSGPIFKDAQTQENTIVVSFHHANGLTAKGTLTAWEVAGADKKYVAA
ncbi:MAG: sialate O-acetylesterase, partial [Planctomycetes bacterium]|nr:sialate O-acetylesterase [Planctomycetota bacterium]